MRYFIYIYLPQCRHRKTCVLSVTGILLRLRSQTRTPGCSRCSLQTHIAPTCRARKRPRRLSRIGAGLRYTVSTLRARTAKQRSTRRSRSPASASTPGTSTVTTTPSSRGGTSSSATAAVARTNGPRSTTRTTATTRSSIGRPARD